MQCFLCCIHFSTTLGIAFGGAELVLCFCAFIRDARLHPPSTLEVQYCGKRVHQILCSYMQGEQDRLVRGVAGCPLSEHYMP